MRLPVLAFLAAFAATTLAAPAQAGIVFKSDYEGGNFSGWTERGFCCGYSQQIVPSPSRAGKYAARFELRDTDPTIWSGTRSEVKYTSSRIGKIGGPGEWYGLSIYLPPDDPADYYTAPTWENEILAQWHDTPDKGEAHKSPPLAIGTTGGQWIIDTRYSSKAFQTANDGARVVHWRSPYKTGVWNDFVVHVKWSWQSDGFLEIWKDGQKIVDYKGPNTYNNQGNNWFQWGIYKWPWTGSSTTDVSKRIVYNDELRIGDSSSSYAEVAPGGSVTPSSGDLPVSGVTASAHDGNVPSNTRDGNLNTRWSAEGNGQWIEYDLGAVKTVSRADIAWYLGDKRQASFRINVSKDRATWTTVRPQGNSSGATLALQPYALTPTQARYVRIIGYGNTQNLWNSITEAKMYGN